MHTCLEAEPITTLSAYLLFHPFKFLDEPPQVAEGSFSDP